MVLITKLPEWLAIRNRLASEGKNIGFVPTMGALHAGHASLLERSRRENDVSVLSIFVNPTQFDNKEDFEKYPVTLEADQAIALQAGVDYLLLPNYNELYS